MTVDEAISTNETILNADQETTTRFSSAEWFEKVQKMTVLIAGIGGIGSWLALLVSRMRPKTLLLMDSDRVEKKNLAGQLYSIKDVYSTKVQALSNMIGNYSDYYNVMAIAENFTEESEAYDIMICGFDNMAARKLYFRKWKEHVEKQEDKSKCLFIDGRLNAEKFQVISIVGDDSYSIERYENEFLFDDSAVEEPLCSLKQTTYCAAMIASYMCNVLVNFACNSVARPVVFFQEYDASFMGLKQIV